MNEPLSTPEQTFAATLFEFATDVEVKVRRRHPTLDDALFGEAFVQAVLEIARKPQKFDSERGVWPDFLAGATLRVLSGRFRSDGARRRREQKKGEALVAERQSAARNPLEELLDFEQGQLNAEWCR